jgi:hypothetical protein
MTQTHFELFETHRPGYLTKARTIARELLQVRDFVTIDDIRELCPPPTGIDPRVMGAVFNRADFEGVGYIQSQRKECHKRPIQKFTLKRA